MRALDATHLVDVLEALYALDRPDDEWLSQCLLALSRVCGKEHHHIGFFYDASNVEDLKVWNWCRLEPSPAELAGVWNVFQSAIDPAFVRATFRSLFVGSGRKTAVDAVKSILAERERNGHGDFFYLNALDPSGIGCMLVFGCRHAEFALQPGDCALLKRIATHLTAAYRCRRRLGRAHDGSTGAHAAPLPVSESAVAIPDTRGRILHAERVAHTDTAQEEIHSTAAAIESTRTGVRRGAGGRMPDRGHPLTSARWTLVDSFEEGGRRYVVARENQTDAPDFSAFTDRERQVVVHAALGLTNKEIAYTLGISATTVRVLVARAARRLGLRTRRELLAHSTLSALRPPADAPPPSNASCSSSRSLDRAVNASR